MKFDVSVCIVTWRSGKLLENCVNALRKCRREAKFETLVVDLGNDHTDAWYARRRIQVLRLDPPCYFAQANNRVAKMATGKYLLFLNPDTEPRQKFLKNMLQTAKTADIVGALLRYPDGLVQHAGITWEDYARPFHFGYGHQLSPTDRQVYPVLAVSGACLLVKRELFNDWAGFDEEFKNGYEDVDFCLRMRQLGKTIKYCGLAEVVHHESGTMGTNGKTPTSLEFLTDNLALLKTKHPRKERFLL